MSYIRHLILSVLVVNGCMPGLRGRAQPSKPCQAGRYATTGDRAMQALKIDSAALKVFPGEIVTLESLDVGCQGNIAFAGQLIPRSGPDSAVPTFAVYQRAPDGSMTRLLWAPSPVAGPEYLAVAADLSGSGHLDLVTLGIDEGGRLPRVFRWSERGYEPVRVPTYYNLRNETEWDAKCLANNSPSVTSTHLLVLSRETISPDSATGHGADCQLRRDTLRISSDTLAAGGGVRE